MGLERTACILQGKTSVYETDVFVPIIQKIEELTGLRYHDENATRAMRIVADHVRTSVFMIGDEKGIAPSNVDQGYVLRRLLRRAIRFMKKLGVENSGGLVKIADVVIKIYEKVYPELKTNAERIRGEIVREEERFEKTLANGLREFDKLCGYLQGDTVSGKAAFRLYDTFGFPLEMTQELATERGLKVNAEDFNQHFAEHQKKSQAGAEQKFKGGLADNSEVTTHLHTATHLMHQALKTVLNDDSVAQRGSNITAERLRFDFSFSRALSREELTAVEELVNAAIAADVEVLCSEMSVDEAKSMGAIGLFSAKYGEKVKVYTMGKFSKEICGGPHAVRTGILGKFKIKKEESSSAGVRRIKAVLE